jgi:hypothetical protein
MPIQCPPISYTEPATWLLQLPQADHMEYEQLPQPLVPDQHQPPFQGYAPYAAPQAPFYIPQQEWTTTYQGIQEMQQMMRSMQLTRTAHGRQIQTICQTQREQGQQIDDIAEYLYQFHMRGYEADSDVSASGDDTAAGGDAAATGDDGQ